MTKLFLFMIVMISRESYQRRGEKVSSILANTFPNTAVLALSSIVFATIFGLLLGIYCALFKDSFADSMIHENKKILINISRSIIYARF